MNEPVMIVTAVAIFAGLYALLGAHFSCIWGIDPSRETPAAERGEALCAVWLLARDVLACLPLALMLAQGAAGLSRPHALALLAFCCLLLGALWFMSLFVSVRHGACGLAGVAQEELGGPARVAVTVLTLGFVLLGMGEVCFQVGYYVLDADPAQITLPQGQTAYAALLLAVLAVLLPANLQARSLRGEGEAAPLAMGGALALGLCAVIAVLGGCAQLAPFSLDANVLPWLVLRQIPGTLLMERLARIGGQTLCTLLPQRRMSARLRFVRAGAISVIVAMVSMIIAFFRIPAVLYAAAACGALLLLVAVVSYARWFARIGRRVI